MEKTVERATELLESLLKGEKVSRWSVHIHRRAIMRLVREEEKYKSLEWEVQDLIDSAKESL